MAHQSNPQFIVHHALRIKGFASIDTLVEISTLQANAVQSHLEQLQTQELALFREARSLWQLTPAGKQAHLEALRQDVGSDIVSLMADEYQPFLTLNESFKELCGEWQLRDGVPNDHADVAYDSAVVAKLTALHAKTEPIVVVFGGILNRMAQYSPRLATACTKVEQGEHKMFTGVMCNSFHDIWMELHEDLILSLGNDRQAEGSF
ncbi:MAG: MarR family transcriptional regulator [Ilumatobacteraceae bacterium]|nr:MarR family transcriptional regulator [Ilumatobacteraceae bacterium]